ncbi:hypothetical protein HL42_2760 [Trichophyton rubrum]|nr:hypothetical protein HL42_2760 [Trichophyton rubrum]
MAGGTTGSLLHVSRGSLQCGRLSSPKPARRCSTASDARSSSPAAELRVASRVPAAALSLDDGGKPRKSTDRGEMPGRSRAANDAADR